MYLCIVFSKLQLIGLYKVFERLREKHKIKWSRVRVSYPIFLNVNLLLNRDLVIKIRKVQRCDKIRSKGYNCSRENKNKYLWGVKCKFKNITCKVTHKRYCEFYIGIMLCNLKKRLNQHYTSVKTMLEAG